MADHKPERGFDGKTDTHFALEGGVPGGHWKSLFFLDEIAVVKVVVTSASH